MGVGLDVRVGWWLRLGLAGAGCARAAWLAWACFAACPPTPAACPLTRVCPTPAAAAAATPLVCAGASPSALPSALNAWTPTHPCQTSPPPAPASSRSSSSRTRLRPPPRQEGACRTADARASTVSDTAVLQRYLQGAGELRAERAVPFSSSLLLPLLPPHDFKPAVRSACRFHR